MRADAERNRELIVQAAIRTLSANPRASMEELAGGSPVSRITVFRHFPSRDDLVKAAWLAAMSEVSDELEQAQLEDLSPEDALREFARRGLALTEHLGFLVRGPQPDLGDPDLAAATVSLTAELQRIIERAQDERCLRDDLSASFLTESFFAVTQAAALTAEPSETTDEVAARALEVFGAGARRP